MLADLHATSGIAYKVVAVDPLESRRTKMEKVLSAIHTNQQGGQFVVKDIESGKQTVNEWTSSIGCNAVLEVRILDACMHLNLTVSTDCRQQQRPEAGV